MTNKLTGREAYEDELKARPTYHDGTPRKTWVQLSEAARWSWYRPATKPLMRQAIQVRYFPATNHRGARLKATAPAGSKFFAYDYELNAAENAQLAATLFAHSKGWTGELAGGQLATGDYVFVFIDA